MNKDVARAWEFLGLSPDDYMMLYWDFPNQKVMAVDHLGKHHTPVGDIYNLVIEDDHVVSFKIKALA